MAVDIDRLGRQRLRSHPLLTRARGQRHLRTVPAAENRPSQLRRRSLSAMRFAHVGAGSGGNRLLTLMLAIGGVVAIGTAVFSTQSYRDLLLAGGGISLFTALLMFGYASGPTVPPSVPRRMYAALASTGDELVGELGLSGRQLYIPTGEEAGPTDVRLHVPPRANPDGAASVEPERVLGRSTDGQVVGISVRPVGLGLYEDFRETSAPGRAGEGELVRGLCHAAERWFGLADRVVPSVDWPRVELAVQGSAYGEDSRFDHPVGSLIASAVASELGRPVEVTYQPPNGGEAGGDFEILIQPTPPERHSSEGA